jgi:alkanesulfonate monooxygenase SsuD/methylene tetrahydromethanopterin reductase-like flavin-dependent oxidoreductase (luciferase family)
MSDTIAWISGVTEGIGLGLAVRLNRARSPG